MAGEKAVMVSVLDRCMAVWVARGGFPMRGTTTASKEEELQKFLAALGKMGAA